MKTKILLLLSLVLILSSSIFAQNVGIGTSTPAEKLHVTGSIRSDAMQTPLAASATTDRVVWIDANGKMYALPTGLPGKVLGLNGAGILSWLNAGLSNSLNDGQIWIGDATNTPVANTPSGDALISNTGVITIQDNAVDGTDITISGESNGSLMYFNGTDWINIGIGAAGQVLTIVAGVPTWVTASSPTTGDLTTTTSGLTITGGTGAVNGTGATVNVATNALSTNGLVTGPTAVNALQVWGTDALGNPGWVDVSALVKVDNGLYYNGVAGKIRQGGALVENTSIDQGNFNYLHNLNGTGVFEARSGATSGAGLFVNPSNQVGIGTSSPLTILHVNNPASDAIIRVETPSSMYESRIEFWKWSGIFGAGVGFYPGTADLHLRTLTSAASIVFDPNSIERMRVTPAGNVGIGTTSPNASALLDISATDKGVLFPRVALTATNVAGPITLPQTALFVYNTATAGVAPNNVVPGYYYNSGTSAAPVWTRLENGGNDWHLLGNAGTSAATNFVGTTDNVDFVTRTNNIERMRVTNAGRVGINTATTGIGISYPWAHLEIVGDGNTNGDILFKSVGPVCDYLTWQTAGGTLPTPAIVATNQLIGYVNWQAHNGTGFINVASMATFMEGGTPTATSLPTAINFGTTPAGSTSQVERMRITNNGNIGIGTTAPNASALLDVTSTSKGVLFPRVALTATNTAGPTTLPATSLLVYNTATAGVSPNDVIPGYYYNSGTSAAPVWSRLENGGNDWHLTGNAGTSVLTNFVGTTDNQHLIFRTNNTEKVRISSAGTLGIGVSAVGANFIDPFSKIETLGDGVYGDQLMHTSGNNSWGNWVTNFRCRGTHLTPAIVQNGDEIAMYNAFAYDGTKYGDPNFFQYAAYLSMNIDGTPGTNDLPTRIAFATTNDGSLVASEKMRITNAGNIAINTITPSATDRVNIVSGTAMNGMLLTSQQTTAGAYGLRNAATFSTGSANTYTGYNGAIAIAGGSVTNAGIFVDVANGSAASIIGSTNGTNNNAAIIGTSTVSQGGNMRSSLASASALVGVNTAASGTSTGNGVFAQTSQSNGVGLYGFNNGPAGISFGYAWGDSRASVYGDGLTGGAYSFGVLGDGGSTTRSGGVFGDDYGFGRGALGYYAASTTDYAVYGFGTAYQTGVAGGKLSGANQEAILANAPNNMVGLGIYGGVMGGWVRGLHYGFHAKGTKYGMYVDGNTVTNKPVIQLIDNGKESRSVSFSAAAMSADVYVRGNMSLRNGSAYISFAENFSNVISAEVPLNITITPTVHPKAYML